MDTRCREVPAEDRAAGHAGEVEHRVRVDPGDDRMDIHRVGPQQTSTLETVRPQRVRESETGVTCLARRVEEPSELRGAVRVGREARRVTIEELGMDEEPGWVRQDGIPVLDPYDSCNSGRARRCVTDDVQPSVVDRERVHIERRDSIGAVGAGARHQRVEIERVFTTPAEFGRFDLTDLQPRPIRQSRSNGRRYPVGRGIDLKRHVRVALNAIEVQLQYRQIVVTREVIDDEYRQRSERHRPDTHGVTASRHRFFNATMRAAA